MSKVSSKTQRSWGLPVNGPVFWSSIAFLVASITLVLIFRENAEAVFSGLQVAVTSTMGWLFILSVNIFVAFCLYVAFSRFGSIRLGGKDAKPEFSTSAWFAMLFSAGMGIGLLFWSIAEPVNHFQTPPLGEPGTPAAARQAMDFTFLHWGLHAWAIYALVALALAFFTYNRQLPLTVRSAFYPFLGERIHGVTGHMIDTLAVIATLFGLATSLGLGVQQVASGLNHVFPTISNTISTQIILIAVITSIATVSVVTGVDKGVRILSEWNIRIALFVLVAVLVLGPTVFILGSYVQNTGSYIGNFMQLSFWNEAYSTSNWQGTWTAFYWAWWISWSPFVGIFIARVSKGRTIREFVLGVLIAPTLLSFLWMTAFGSTALHETLAGDPTIADAVASDVSTALFVFFEQLPFSTILSVIGVLLIAGFFVTSSDSGSLVVVSLTSGGVLNPPVGLRVFWALAGGAVAAVLLLGGGLQALQTAVIITGLPFAIILLLMCYSLYRGLDEESTEASKLSQAQERKAYQQLVTEMLAKRVAKQQLPTAEGQRDKRQEPRTTGKPIAIDTMMVCLDLSDIDEKLVAFTHNICQRLPTQKVYFVHNIKTAELGNDTGELLDGVDLSQEVEASISEIIQDHFAGGCDYEILVSEEPNTEVMMADLVKRYGVKLTILGKKMSNKSTGALGTKLLRSLPCSVLVYPEAASFTIERVLTPIDFSDTSVHALRLSKRLSDQLNLNLEIMHVYKLPSQYFPLISEEKAVKKAEELVSGRFKDLQKRHQEIAEVPYTLVRAAGKSTAERISMQLRKGKHDLLVLGLKGNSPIPSLSLGSVPTELYNMDIATPLWLVYSEAVMR
nr:BCCT family transporter [Cytophagales bacterium]